MVYFVEPFRVSLLLWALFIASSSSDKINGNSTSSNLITNFLRKIVIPYIENHQLFNDNPEPPADSKTLRAQIENAIKQKIMKLKPMLQDDRREYNDIIKPKSFITSDIDDKTGMYQFIVGDINRKAQPKPPSTDTQQKTDTQINNNIETYKQIRQQIISLLQKEKTSTSTRDLITKTLDDMLALLMIRKCPAKSLENIEIVNHLLKNMPPVKGQNKLMCYLRPGPPDIQVYTEIPSFNVPTMKSSDNAVVQGNKVKDQGKGPCENFIVCPKGLTDFFKNTYRDLNETAFSTLTNYAAMYVRDVKEETKSVKDSVSLELEKLSKSAESKVHQIFLKELEAFTLAENKDKTENFAHMDHFIKATTAHIKSSIDRIISSTLAGKKTRLFSTIKDDLTVNLKMDMENLNRLLKTKICGFFEPCQPNRAKITTKTQTVRPTTAKHIEIRLPRSFDDVWQNSLDRGGDHFRHEQTFAEPRYLAIEPKEFMLHANLQRRAGSATNTEGSFSSENESADQFFK